jgi:Cd2+/Zn2+-exporting ATPase
VSESVIKGHSTASPVSTNTNAVDTGTAQAAFYIEDMDCPTEESLIRGKLEKLPGVIAMEFNLIQRILTIDHDLSSLESVEHALAEIGMQAVRKDAAQDELRTQLSIAQMDCPTEEDLIRGKLSAMEGISSLDFNLVQRTLTVTHEERALPGILEGIESLGYNVEVRPAANSFPKPAESAPQAWGPLAVSVVAATLSEVSYWIIGGNHWAVVALALLAIFSGGLPTYKKGWVAIRNLNLNINALMSIAVTGAMIIGYWPEAAMVTALFALAELIEAKSLDRARNAIRSLMEIAPETAVVEQADGTWFEMDASHIAIQSHVRVKPGERIALDGEVISGYSTVNQAPITGESLPVEKVEGDPVFAGTINESGSFEYRVTASASNSTLARIIHAVEAAQGSRAPTQRFVDRFARIYTPIVFCIAMGVAILPYLLFGSDLIDSVYKALVLLVIACPCALVISTPVSIVSGLAAGARQGILIKGGVYLEEGRKLTWLALDKTGTLTHGKPAQANFEAWGDNDPSAVRSLAASLADRSDHPVSRAIAEAAEADAVALHEVSDFNALPGRGVRGYIEGSIHQLGNHLMVEELELCSPELEARLSALESQGKTAVVLTDSNGVLALFAVADTVKESSRSAIAELHDLGVNTMMLTGDNPHTAEAIACQVGIDRVQGNLLPEEKQREVARLVREGKTGMVGDGINDAPALAIADIGFAMGAIGTDTAIETADVALMDDDLRKVPAFIRLSRNTASILKQNIVLALGIKAVFLVVAFTGHATMWMAVFADMGASLLVVGNGLRLLRK